MLKLRKNCLVTSVAKDQVEIRQLEIEWFSNNYSTMTGQAAMLGGFALSSLTMPMPEEHEPEFWLEFCYLFMTCATIGMELACIILSSYLSVWGPGLALRGHRGTADLHEAVEVMRDYQESVFAFFILGWIIYFFTSILQVWIYFKRRVAFVVTFPLAGFIFLLVWYSISLTANLRVSYSDLVYGKIDALGVYETIGDLDKGINVGEAGQSTDYVPVFPNAR
eukprot:gnl/TRDRNA2_/TRDRNA2_30757_c0_seq1.p2 gnl/TRDRNA2_/TRDRNA2_30757_c0~~gnl/TRDRNA2_/TRDRNA2_30757_c0_seq1.p2  ORF type:complete len:222 (+),score=50.04 gnl/TRDRNA2_/TRDRNA2_30757_c0_seq1:78-743(+)